MKYYFLIPALLLSALSGCSRWSQIEAPTIHAPTAIFVNAINFVPVNHPRFIKNSSNGYYEHCLDKHLPGELPNDYTKTIYENKEHEGRLVITPYSRLSITLSDNSGLATFYKDHAFELRDENNQVVPTYNDYKNGQFHVEIKGLDNIIKDSIVIQPKAYLGGGLVESINKLYTLKIIHKSSKRTVYVKECITLFEASPFLLLQICVVPTGWEDADNSVDIHDAIDTLINDADEAGNKKTTLPNYYMFHPEYYHWVRRASVDLDYYYLNKIVGKSYTKGYSQFPIRVEIDTDDPNYAQGRMAYGDGLKAEIDKIRETINHNGVIREVYHLYHSKDKMAPLFGWKKWSGDNKPYYTQVMNADAQGGMRQRVRINQYVDYHHEVGHTFALGHNAGCILYYTWRGYNSFCFQNILPYFYEFRGTEGKGVLRKNERGVWVGDSQNVLILPGGFHQPLTKIKIEEGKIILPVEKISPIKEGLKGEELQKQNERIVAEKVSQNDALYFFEPNTSGQYKMTFYHTPVNSSVYGDMVVKVHAESIEGNVSTDPNVKVSERRTQVNRTVLLTVKKPLSKKDDNFSLQNMTFQKGKSYAIFIHYEVPEADDRSFEENDLVFQGVEVTKQ